MNEGERADFTVTLSSGGSQSVTVKYATVDGTALAGSDYTAAASNSTLVFNPGDTKTISVQTRPDTIAEPTETFTLTLSDNTDNTFLASATGTIIDDDRGDLTINNVTVNEGERADFTVTLSSGGSQSVTVKYATVDGTALAGSDYTAAASNSTLVFNPGDTKTISVQTRPDTIAEPTETFTLTLSDNTDNTFLASATGTIIDDDRGDLTINNVTVNEGERADFTVTLSSGGSQSVTVKYATVDGTALAGSDYTAAASNSTLVFNPGDT